MKQRTNNNEKSNGGASALKAIEGLGECLQDFWAGYSGWTRTQTRDTSVDGYHYLSGIIRLESDRTMANISRTAGVPVQNRHHYISKSPWSGAQVIKQARLDIAAHSHFASGSVLIGDESADDRRGVVLVGGGRQYTGALWARRGKVDFSQVGVFLSLAKDGKHNWHPGFPWRTLSAGSMVR